VACIVQQKLKLRVLPFACEGTVAPDVEWPCHRFCRKACPGVPASTTKGKDFATSRGAMGRRKALIGCASDRPRLQYRPWLASCSRASATLPGSTRGTMRNAHRHIRAMQSRPRFALLSRRGRTRRQVPERVEGECIQCGNCCMDHRCMFLEPAGPQRFRCGHLPHFALCVRCRIAGLSTSQATHCALPMPQLLCDGHTQAGDPYRAGHCEIAGRAKAAHRAAFQWGRRRRLT